VSDEEELIDGIYKEIMVISNGGSSQVLECVEQATGRHVAMKLLKEESPDFKDNKKVMKYESEVMKQIDHPLIIKFERFSTSRDYTYIVMEHFRASNVKLQLKSDMRSVHVRARKLFECVCAALSHVHSRGLIHRDIKPDNVLMNKVGEIRLVDFSLATKEVKGFAKMVGGGQAENHSGDSNLHRTGNHSQTDPRLPDGHLQLGNHVFRGANRAHAISGPHARRIVDEALARRACQSLRIQSQRHSGNGSPHFPHVEKETR